MNADPQAGPWMPRIQQLPKLGIVGVLKGIMRACLETQKLEQLESRMDEITDRVARHRTTAARERTSNHEAQRPSY
jgi:hypothetical protein